MGTISNVHSHQPVTGLGGVLFTPVQQRVLGLLFGQPERRFQSSELIRLAASGTGAAHRLLTRLADSGLVNVERVGNQKHYQANRTSPIFAELHGLIAKSSASPATSKRKKSVKRPLRSGAANVAVHEPAGRYESNPEPAHKVAQKLRISQTKLETLCRKYGVTKLSLFGSAARNELTPESDVDLLVEFSPDSRTSLFDMTQMQDEFSAALGGRKVDIATPEILRNPFRRESIERDLKPIYEA